MDLSIGTTKTSETATLKVQGDVEITGSIAGDLQANTASASTLDINASTDLDSEHYLISRQECHWKTKVIQRFWYKIQSINRHVNYNNR